MVNRARSGGIDQGKPVFGTFKGERANAKVMGNPSKNPYNKSDFISYMVCDLPPGGRDQNIFSPFSRQRELVQDRFKGGHQRDQDNEGNREGSVVDYILYVFFQP